MLDTHGRKYVQPFIKFGAKIMMKLGLSANKVTVIAFAIGILGALVVLLDKAFIGMLIIWFSGYLDAVDGTIAREQGSTPFGTVMDITFDRIVEIALIVVLAVRHPDSSFLMLILACSIIFSMTVFLTVGNMSDKISEKSFHYQAGVAERSEGFIMFSLMVLFQGQLKIFIFIFIVLVLFTAFQRMREAHKILK